MRLVFTFIACRMEILCVICHDLLTSSEDIFFTPCGHVFHHRCLLQWLERSSTCPQCRANVTQNRIHKAHFTVSNTETASDNAENLSSQDRIDSLKFQILLNERNIKNYTSMNATLEKQNAGLRQEVRKVESEMNQKNSAIYTLKEQINYFKERYEALRKKLSWEESMHKTLSTGTLEDVQAMVGQTTDCNTLLNCISDLKQVLLKKTRKIESLRAQLTEQENKSLERVAFHESENVFLQYRVGQLEKLLTSDQTVLLQPPCVTKSSSQRNSNENSLINVQTVDVCNQQINTKQQTADKNGPSSPEAEVEIIDNADTFDECPTVIKKAKLCLRSGGVNIATSPRWYRPFIAPGATAPANTQGSALIAQLTQPPSSIGLNVAAFSQRLDVAGNNVWAANQRLMMLLQQQNVQQATMSMANQPTHSQPGSQLTVSCISQSVPTQVPQTVTASQQAPVSVSSITQQITHSQAQGNVTTGTVQSQQLVPRERQNIWQGIVEWIEKAKNPTDGQKQTRHVPCQVSVNAQDGDPELKADTWPPKLILQFMSKQLIGSIGGTYLKYAKSVLFHPTPCEALESLTEMMTAGFAGVVHFTSAASSPACEIKVLILLYTLDKKTYVGFIPNEQIAFVDRFRKVVQQYRNKI